ncbi:MAG TPA: MBL fold metallo-hydrolase [Solirubrobacteraceae bacterium]|jgi:L-ascorbate metabolism protein UlaG (beta-lactamase superfamily)|nr:MBL fold metallo-hydrolase [Solirubrobacteraceae bacterium]
MQVEWYGQSSFRVTGGGQTVAIDPFGDMSALAGRGIEWAYPPIVGLEATLVLVTHEHGDHNAVEVVGGDAEVLRSTAGTLPSPVGEVTAVASEHDEVAGAQRGPNTIFVFELDGLRVCHMGDFGQAALREEQAAAIGPVDLLIVPVGGGPTIGAAGASAAIERLAPRWVVPMHYRTSRIGFLEPVDEFLSSYENVVRLELPAFDTAELPREPAPVIVVPAAP